MRKLKFGYEEQLYSSLDDQAIAVIALCVNNIDELEFRADDITINGWEILSTAISKRPTPVSWR